MPSIQRMRVYLCFRGFLGLADGQSFGEAQQQCQLRPVPAATGPHGRLPHQGRLATPLPPRRLAHQIRLSHPELGYRFKADQWGGLLRRRHPGHVQAADLRAGCDPGQSRLHDPERHHHPG